MAPLYADCSLVSYGLQLQYVHSSAFLSRPTFQLDYTRIYFQIQFLSVFSLWLQGLKLSSCVLESAPDFLKSTPNPGADI